MPRLGPILLRPLLLPQGSPRRGCSYSVIVVLLVRTATLQGTLIVSNLIFFTVQGSGIVVEALHIVLYKVFNMYTLCFMINNSASTRFQLFSFMIWLTKLHIPLRAFHFYSQSRLQSLFAVWPRSNEKLSS